MALGDRKKIILKAVVDDYIKTGEPVGSKTLAEQLGIKLSPATLRNEMSELESLGFLEQPHTSAGRVPSHKGYRMYVDELMAVSALSKAERERMDKLVKSRVRELDRLISEAAAIVSYFTSYAAYAGTFRSEDAKLKKLEIITLDRNTCVLIAVFSANEVKNSTVKRPAGMEDETLRRLAESVNRRFAGSEASAISAVAVFEIARESGAQPEFCAVVIDFLRESAESLVRRELTVDGAAKMLSLPDFREPERAHRLISYLSDRSAQDMLPAPEENGRIKIIIGKENLVEELSDSSVVTASYDLGDGLRGVIGVVGPTRMDYAKVASRLGYFMRALGGPAAENGEDNTDGSENK